MISILLGVKIMIRKQENFSVICPIDCGNAPKKQLLKDFTIALLQNQLDYCYEWITDNIVWELVGDKRLEGKKEWLAFFEETNYRGIQELHIHNIITHGNTASLNGTIYFDNGQKIAFCDVYNFSGFGKKAKIKSVTSYVIPLQ